MDFQTYILNNFVMLFELIGLIIILFISAHVSKVVRNYTRLAVLLLFLSITITLLESWTQTFTTLSIWRPILTSLKYLIYPSISIILIMLVSENNKPLPKKWIIALLIPHLITVPIYFSSQWTKLVFHFSNDNHYGGGVLSNLPYFIFSFYLVIFVGLNILYLKNYSVRNRIIALYITLVSAACVVVYAIIGKTDDYNPIFTSALVLYLFFIYIHKASIDTLTGLRNRQSYYQDILEGEHNITFVASVDMNDLKIINDTKGHAAGDEALSVVAKTINGCLGRKTRCYRVGGDEFMILSTLEHEDEINAMIKQIKEALNNCPYPCAFGYAERKNGKSIEGAIKESDELMYVNKAEMKNKK